MSYKKESENKNVIALFLSLPIVLVILLVAVGLSGIYISKESSNSLQDLNRKALGPALAFQEITVELKDLSQNIIIASSDSSPEKLIKKSIKKSKKAIKKLDRLIVTQIENSKGLVFEKYLSKWSNKWQGFKGSLAENLEDPKLMKAKGSKLFKK